jgi:chloramphenicol 3-O-phosphotransferase
VKREEYRSEATKELTTKPESPMMLQRAYCKRRSIDMTSDSGFHSQETDYARHIQEVLDELRQMQQLPQLVTSPEALEDLERKIRQRTDRLGSLLVGQHLQQALDADTFQAEQAQLVRQWPKPLKNDGKVTVMVRTVQGLAVPVRLTYY